MRKYIDPDFDLIKIGLVADTVITSQTVEDPLDKDQGSDPDDEFGDGWD